MKITELDLPGVLLVQPDTYEDERGFFLETWNHRRYPEAGFPECEFVQVNHSRSVKGVLRGLHYQKTALQGKLVQVSNGSIFDVAVDVRPHSPTFGQWVGQELSDTNHHQLWIPPGFAHGFCALSESVDLIYKCTALYEPDDERGIIWNDNDIDIDWPTDNPKLSAKDQNLPALQVVDKAGDLPVLSD